MKHAIDSGYMVLGAVPLGSPQLPLPASVAYLQRWWGPSIVMVGVRCCGKLGWGRRCRCVFSEPPTLWHMVGAVVGINH